MALTNNPNRGSKKDFKRIDRGNDIKPKESVNVNDMYQSNEKSQQQNDNKVDSVTYYANVRINNHIKNKLDALNIIGVTKTKKEAIDNAIDYYLESLDSETKRKYDLQYQTLEDRDVNLKGGK